MQERVRKQLLSMGMIRDLTERSQQQCWLDHSASCPYGNPGGRFELRPTDSCHIGVCQEIKSIEGEVEEMFAGGFSTAIQIWCSKNEPITLSKMLSNVTEDTRSKFDDDEKILLRAVADMLKNSNGDNDLRVYYAEDLV